MNAGSIPIDLILFGLFAVFLALRLRSVLGKRDGFEQKPLDRAPLDGRGPPRPDQRAGQRFGNRFGFGGARPAPTIEGKAEPVPAPRPLPDPLSPAGAALAQLRAADAGFDPARFLAGAEHAFRLIVDNFAAGNRTALRPLLTPETFATFDAAISARDQAGESQRTEIRHIAEAAIVAARLRPDAGARMAEIEIRFVSDQVAVTLDRDDKVVAGVDAVTEISDLWTFERDLNGKDPAWRLAAARSA